MSLVIYPQERTEGLAEASRFLASLAPDKPWEITAKPWVRRRSHQQNSYLWGICYPTILQSGQLEGWDSEDLHEYFLGEHFGWETLKGFGKKRIRPIKRSSRLDKIEFATYVSFVQRKAAEMGIYIADSGEL